jgi:endonuclease/exonuclease/phosphatase family metal-dependent hydrolase
LWAHDGKCAKTIAEPGPTLRALGAYRRFLRQRPSILAGDLNNHIRWDKPRKASNHANAVAGFARIGMVSAYHAFFGLAQGAELHPTLYWRDRMEAGPTYHIDYAFLTESALGAVRSVEVGTHADWVAAGLSDHVPLILDLDPRFAPPMASPIVPAGVGPRVVAAHMSRQVERRMQCGSV